MWNRKELKSSAKKLLYKRYWTMVAVCFLMAIIIGEYGMSTTSIFQFDHTVKEPIKIINTDTPITGWDYLDRVLAPTLKQSIDEIGGTSFVARIIRTAVSTLINATTQSKKFMMQFLLAAHAVSYRQDWFRGGVFGFTGLVAIAFYIWIANILAVGEKRFFLEVRLYPGTQIRRIFYLYKEKKVANVAKIMLLKTIFLTFWCFTVVGGIIKYYEYRMIPYILAENPYIKRKQAFALSKELMTGQKWHTFLLDLSFLGWIILQPFTFGLFGLLFSNPYYAATNAELYMTLRKDCIDNKKENYDQLNDPYIDKLPDLKTWAESNGY